MPSFIDRLLGRPEPPVADAKAVVGPGAFAMERGVALTSLRRTPQALARQAMDAYRQNEWVNTAESLIDDKFATVPWHLEDTEGETVEPDTADPTRQEILRFLRKPSPMWSRSQMLRLTCRHMGLPGRAFWYLDRLNLTNGVPQGAYTIAPDRMWAATDNGGNLLGWVMDADRNDGKDPVPFTLDEIIQFPLDPPDEGYFGVGKVEAAWRKILLTQHSDEYAAQLFASGGRIPGVMFPRPVQSGNVTFNTEEWESFVRALRDSNSIDRRMSALRAAVDYVRTAESPNALELPDLSMLSRDDTIAIWKVPKSQLGMEAKTGLNGGERNKYDEASLWQNAIEPRLTTFVELIQERILDRHGLILVVETPSFDDDLPLYEIAEKARWAPLTVDQRLASVGLDPLDPAVYGQLGQSIFMDNQMVQVFPKPAPPPELAPFGGAPGETPQNGTDDPSPDLPETDVSSKAKLHFEQIRSRVERKYQPAIDQAVQAVLQAQKADIAARVRDKAEHIAAKPNDDTVWWNERREHERLQGALEPLVLRVAADVTRTTSATFFRPVKADSLVDRVADYVRNLVGQRIRGINQTTRETLSKVIGDGVARGDSPQVLGDAIEASTAFGEYRSELIARTETMLAYNDAAIGTYRDFGVEEVQAIDGDEDPECAARNGAIYSITEASGISDHPNGTLDWVPVVKALSPTEEGDEDTESDMKPAELKAVIEGIVTALRQEAPPITVNLPEQPITVNVPEAKAPVINYTPPAVDIKIPETKAATGPQEVVVTKMPNRVHRAVRDSAGKVTGSYEGDA